MIRACPICRREVPDGAEHRPFCSARCKDVDLGNWLNEAYRISRPMALDEIEQAVLDEPEEEEGPGLLH